MSGEPYPGHINWQAIYNATTSPRVAWLCPGCKTWHAPHVDGCYCAKAERTKPPGEAT